MKRLALTSLLLAACSAPGVEHRRQLYWSMDAALAESCCCDAICPCIVGSAPTQGHCRGNRLVEIEEGQYLDTNLDGVAFIVTFDIPHWTRLYFSDRVSEDQVEATIELLKHQKSFLFGELLEVKRVPLTIEREANRLSYRTPAGNTDIEVMTGFEGKPIEVQNLTNFRDYVQYKSTQVQHTCSEKEHDFEYEGTNGFTARYQAEAWVE